MSRGGPGGGAEERTGWGFRPSFLSPSPATLSASSVAQGPLEPLLTRPSLFPPLEDLGQAYPRPVPRSDKQVLSGSSLTLSRQRAAPGPTQALSWKQRVCSAGGPRVLAWEPLWGLPQPGDHGCRLASLDPSVSLQGRSVGQDACGYAHGRGLQHLRGLGRCDGALGLGRRAGQAGLSAGAAVGARVRGWG